MKKKLKEKKQRKRKGKGKGKDIGKNKEKSKEKKSNLVKLNLIGEKKHSPYATEQCSLKAEIIFQFPKHHIPFDVFSEVMFGVSCTRI